MENNIITPNTNSKPTDFERIKLLDQTKAVLEELKALQPSLKLEIVNKEETAYVDDEVSEFLIAVSTDDEQLIDPFTSSCGRFTVEPEIAYGIDKDIAKIICDHNFMHRDHIGVS